MARAKYSLIVVYAYMEPAAVIFALYFAHGQKLMVIQLQIIVESCRYLVYNTVWSAAVCTDDYITIYTQAYQRNLVRAKQCCSLTVSPAANMRLTLVYIRII